MKTILILLFITLSTLQAQDLKKDMEQLVAAYQAAKNISLDISTKIYQGELLTETRESGHLEITEGHYFYDYGNHKMLVNEEWIIMLNTVEKFIICEPFTAEKAKKMKQQNVLNFDKMFESYSEVAYKGIVNGLKHYVLTNNEEKYSTIEVFFEESRGLITAVKYHINPKF